MQCLVNMQPLTIAENRKSLPYYRNWLPNGEAKSLASGLFTRVIIRTGPVGRVMSGAARCVAPSCKVVAMWWKRTPARCDFCQRYAALSPTERLSWLAGWEGEHFTWGDEHLWQTIMRLADVSSLNGNRCPPAHPDRDTIWRDAND